MLRTKLKKYETLSYGSCALNFSSMISIYLWSFMLMPCIILKLCSGQNSSIKHFEKMAITLNVWNGELWFLCTALFLNDIYLPMTFCFDVLHNFKVMLRTKFKHENEQRVITPKVSNFQFWVLCTVLLLNEIYLPMKCHVDALHSFKVMLRTTRNGPTDGQTDGRVSLYATLRRHKNRN